MTGYGFSLTRISRIRKNMGQGKPIFCHILHSVTAKNCQVLRKFLVREVCENIIISEI